MLEVIFAACSLLHGGHCQEFHLTLDQVPGMLSSFACMRSQSQIAQWQVDHPNWIFNPASGYQCRPAGLIAKT
jgi:hypothetical protein